MGSPVTDTARKMTARTHTYTQYTAAASDRNADIDGERRKRGAGAEYEINIHRAASTPEHTETRTPTSKNRATTAKNNRHQGATKQTKERRETALTRPVTSSRWGEGERVSSQQHDTPSAKHEGQATSDNKKDNTQASSGRNISAHRSVLQRVEMCRTRAHVHRRAGLRYFFFLCPAERQVAPMHTGRQSSR